MRQSFFYDFSNYGSYEQLTDDGLTQWHPAFLQLGNSLEECARKYKGFCYRYKPKKKTPTRCHWGSRLLAGVSLSESNVSKKSHQGKGRAGACQVTEDPEVARVSRKFIAANRPPSTDKKDF
ncbi:MAG: hypothetical protein F6K26_05735 [Moorea sp. SIO2I5]|nr:hypothetical protein [Moorena sp. SIO2I5]